MQIPVGATYMPRLDQALFIGIRRQAPEQRRCPQYGSRSVGGFFHGMRGNSTWDRCSTGVGIRICQPAANGRGGTITALGGAEDLP